MDVYYNNSGIWKRSDRLFDALGLYAAVKQKNGEPRGGPYVIALTGAGGKTSIIRRLAWEGRELGLRVLVVTTTHMAVPARLGVFTGRAADVKEMLDRESVAVACSIAGGGKVSFVDGKLYEAACHLADLVLVEADGSKRLPLKVPGPGEPVILENTDMILCASGLTSVGKPAVEKCFRLDAAAEIMQAHGRLDYGGREVWRIAPEDLCCLMRYGYLKPLRARYPDAGVIPVFSQADTPELAELARKLLSEMKEISGAVCGGLTKEPSAELF